MDLIQVQDKFDILYKYGKGNSIISAQNFDFKVEDTLYEKMHTRFLKFILNVNKFVSNSAVRGELGRYPMSVKVLSLSVKYWHNIITNRSPNILLRAALHSENSIYSHWTQGIEFVLTTNGLAYVWGEHSTITPSCLYNLLKQRLTDQYIQTWIMDNRNKTSPLSLIKQTYDYSKYLSYIRSPEIRSIFTKMRINNNIMFNNSNQYNDQLTCPMCSTNIVDVAQHALLECSKTLVTREAFSTSTRQIVKHYNMLSLKDKLLLILDLKVDLLINKSHEEDFITKVTSYIKYIYYRIKNNNFHIT